MCLALGTIGVGFRAAGFGWVVQSLIALGIGFVSMLSGLLMASNDRHDALHEPLVGNDLRLVRPNLHAVSVNQNEWNAARPDRVKVHAWRSDQYALPPGRTA